MAKGGWIDYNFFFKGRGYVPVEAGFSPTSISDLHFWYNGQNVEKTGSDIDTLTDLSGKGFDAAFTSGNAAQSGTLNSLDTISNSGVATASFTVSFGGDNITQPFTFFAVAKADSAATQYILQSAAELSWWANTSKMQNMFQGATLAGSTNDDTSWHLFTARFNGVNSINRLDGSDETTGNTSSRTLTNIRVMAGGSGANSWTGDVAEVLGYNKLLDTDEVDLVEEWLDSKYGLGFL